MTIRSGEDVLAGYPRLAAGSPPASVPGSDPRLYAGRAWHGQGVAQALMDAVLANPATAGRVEGQTEV